jgi:hypothetical protein
MGFMDTARIAEGNRKQSNAAEKKRRSFIFMIGNRKIDWRISRDFTSSYRKTRFWKGFGARLRYLSSYQPLFSDESPTSAIFRVYTRSKIKRFAGSVNIDNSPGPGDARSHAPACAGMFETGENRKLPTTRKRISAGLPSALNPSSDGPDGPTY